MGRAMELARTRLKAWRAKRGETQKSVGAVLGWDQATVSKFELGNQDATVDQLAALAAHFERPLCDLFEDLEPDAENPRLAEWIDYYWRLSEKGREAQLDTWRQTVGRAARPSGESRRSVRRELSRDAETPPEPEGAGHGKRGKRDTPTT